MSSDVHGDIMYSGVIHARIEELLATPVKYARDLDEWETEELEDLLAFRKAVTGQYGDLAWAKGISFVSDNYQGEYAAQMAEEIYGEATKENAWNDDVWEEDYYGTDKNPGAQTFTLEDTEYWTDGQR